MTAYKVATNPGDYQRAHALLKAEGMKEKLSFPTIIAFDDADEVIGVFSTAIQRNMIIAGPMVLRSDKRRSFTALRLFEFYENAMRNMGITSFIFHTEAGHIFDKIVQSHLDLTPYAVKDGRNFYIRKLTDGRKHDSTGAATERGGDGASASAS